MRGYFQEGSRALFGAHNLGVQYIPKGGEIRTVVQIKMMLFGYQADVLVSHSSALDVLPGMFNGVGLLFVCLTGGWYYLAKITESSPKSRLG